MTLYNGQELKLDLACGDNKREGFFGVDFIKTDSTDFECNLLKFPWPWEDNSVEELHCSHFIEHVPMCYISPTGEYKNIPEPGDKDLLFAFFDECYRILKPGASLTIWCPCARSNRAFQDVTHRRFIVGETFLYMNKEWRTVNKLEHYNVQCDFIVNVDPMVASELALLHPEAAARRINESWNIVYDWKATLIKK